jgi:hypothetical protein
VVWALVLAAASKRATEYDNQAERLNQ